jgi:predicted transcriptional regulator
MQQYLNLIFDKFLNMDNETIEFVQRSTYRQRVLTSLDGNVLMPKEIAERSNIKTNHVSKVLSELKSKELIEIINPEVRKGRLYRQTNKGKIVSKNIITE